MRMIDADKLTELCDIMAEKCDGIGESVWHQFRITVEWSPTVDAEPVVRCRDCKYGSCTGEYGKYYECELSEGEVAPLWREDDFCSYGERREDGAE